MWRLHNLLDRTLISLLQCWRKNVLNSQIKNGMQKKPNEIIMSTTHFITKMIEKHTDTHPICYFQRISEFRIVIFAWRTRRAHDQIYEFHLNEFTVLINYLWHSNFSLNSLSSFILLLVRFLFLKVFFQRQFDCVRNERHIGSVSNKITGHKAQQSYVPSICSIRKHQKSQS